MPYSYSKFQNAACCSLKSMLCLLTSCQGMFQSFEHSGLQGEGLQAFMSNCHLIATLCAHELFSE